MRSSTKNCWFFPLSLISTDFSSFNYSSFRPINTNYLQYTSTLTHTHVNTCNNAQIHLQKRHRHLLVYSFFSGEKTISLIHRYSFYGSCIFGFSSSFDYNFLSFFSVLGYDVVYPMDSWALITKHWIQTKRTHNHLPNIFIKLMMEETMSHFFQTKSHLFGDIHSIPLP